jgi:type III secretion protein T
MSVIEGSPATLLLLLSVAVMRTGVALALIPMFGRGGFPVLALGALAMALALPVVYAQQEFIGQIGARSLIGLVPIFAREAIIGLLIGVGFGALFAGVRSAGEIIDHQTGLTFTQALDPVNGNQVSVTSTFLGRTAVAYLLASGFGLLLADVIYTSYEVWPLDAGAPSLQMFSFERLIVGSASLFALGVLLAGPVLLVLFAVELAGGMLNRAAPQLNVFSLTLTMKAWISLLVLFLAMPALLQRLAEGMVGVARTTMMMLRGT